MQKLGRNRGPEEGHASGLDPLDDVDHADVPSGQWSSHRPDFTRRAGSEPTEQLLASIPSHLRPPPPPIPPTIKRNVSAADSHFPGATDRHHGASRDADEIVPISDYLGLKLIHSPEGADLDFIFVHGLGGSALKTWSHHRDIKNFWPLWLHRELEFSTARIFSFGYNANFRGVATTFNITDFAKDLLLRMQDTFTDPDVEDDSSREPEDTRIGKVS